jgi:hypothetical protein
MKVLAIDIGGTHVKLLVTGQKEHSEFASSPDLTPAMLLAGVRRVAKDWKYDTVSFGYLQKLFDDRVELRLGRIGAGDDFLVCQYDYLFMQNGFDGNPVGIFFNSPGMTAYGICRERYRRFQRRLALQPWSGRATGSDRAALVVQPQSGFALEHDSKSDWHSNDDGHHDADGFVRRPRA